MLLHIMVDDIEVTIQKIIERGGKIVRPLGLDAPEITAWFQDLSGNILGLYQEPG
jgi:predicted enzyme related to lactoylglutathione lyase